MCQIRWFDKPMTVRWTHAVHLFGWACMWFRFSPPTNTASQGRAKKNPRWNHHIISKLVHMLLYGFSATLPHHCLFTTASPFRWCFTHADIQLATSLWNGVVCAMIMTMMTQKTHVVQIGIIRNGIFLLDGWCIPKIPVFSDFSETIIMEHVYFDILFNAECLSVGRSLSMCK